jgi:hypothetical protein
MIQLKYANWTSPTGNVTNAKVNSFFRNSSPRYHTQIHNLNADLQTPLNMNDSTIRIVVNDLPDILSDHDTYMELVRT